MRWYGLIVVAALACLIPSGAWATGWNQLGIGLQGKNVSSIASDPSNANNLAAISGGVLYTSTSAGLIWHEEVIAAVVTAVAYDPSHIGRLWVGAYEGCLLERDAGEISWHQFTSGSDCYPSSIVPTERGVYYLNNGYSINRPMILGLDRVIRPTAYTGPRPFTIASGPRGAHLYVSSLADVQRSDDTGATWQALSQPPNVGCCVNELWANDESVWLLGFGRPYSSSNNGNTWHEVGPVVPHGYSVARLIVHGATPFFTLVDDDGRAPDVVSTAEPTAGLGLELFAQALTVTKGSLVAATPNGVWRYGTKLPSAAERKHPVIVIPGFAGSWPAYHGIAGTLVIDPIAHTYDGLLARLRAAGFNEQDHSLVPFPYQWRQDNVTSARKLSEQIRATTAVCGCSQVDLVAHSMGGLVARAYIESDYYHNDVARLVEIGTPNQGTPMAYPAWENGSLSYDAFGLVQRALAPLLTGLVRVEGYTQGFVSVVDYIRMGIPSLGELLPTSSYLAGRTYPAGYPTNTFLDTLNSNEGLSKLHNRVGLFVVGSKMKDTISGFTVSEPSSIHTWPHGAILSRQLGSGDGTVMDESLLGAGSVNHYYDADHGGIVTAATNDIIAYLLGDIPDEHYTASVPNEPELVQAVKDVPTPLQSGASMLIYAPVASNLTLASTTTINNSYRWSDETGEYLIIQAPIGQLPTNIDVTITSSNTVSTPIHVGAITTTDPSLPSQTAEVVVPEHTGPVTIQITNTPEGTNVTFPSTSETSKNDQITPQIDAEHINNTVASSPVTLATNGLLLAPARLTRLIQPLPRFGAVVAKEKQLVESQSKELLAKAQSLIPKITTHGPLIFAAIIGLVAGIIVWLILLWLWFIFRRRREQCDEEHATDYSDA